MVSPWRVISIFPLSVLSKLPGQQPDPAQLLRWAGTVAGLKAALQFERQNPLRLDIAKYQERVSFLYQNALMATSCFAENWYAYFQFLHTFSPLRALQLLKMAVQRLDDDLFLRLTYITHMESYLYNGRFLEYLLGGADLAFALEGPSDSSVGYQLGTSGQKAAALAALGPAAAGLGDPKTKMAALQKLLGKNGGMAQVLKAKNLLLGDGPLLEEDLLFEDLELVSGLVDVEESDDAKKAFGGTMDEDEVVPASSRAKTKKSKSNVDAAKALEQARFLILSKLFEDALDCSQTWSREQLSLVAIHYLNFVRRCGPDGLSGWRTFFMKEILLKHSTHLAWEVYAAVASTEYHCCNDKDRCLKIYRLGLSKFATEPSFVSNFVHFLVSINDLSAAKTELATCLQNIYKTWRTLSNVAAKEKQRLEKGFRFLFEKLVRLEQLYGKSHVGVSKLLQGKNKLFLSEAPLDQQIQDAEKQLLGQNLDEEQDEENRNGPDDHRSAQMNDDALSHKDVGTFLRQSAEQLLSTAIPEEDAVLRDFIQSSFLVEFSQDNPELQFLTETNNSLHVDRDYANKEFLEAHLLSGILEDPHCSFRSFTKVLPMPEAVSRFRFFHLVPQSTNFSAVTARQVRRLDLLFNAAQVGAEDGWSGGAMWDGAVGSNHVERKAPMLVVTFRESGSAKTD